MAVRTVCIQQIPYPLAKASVPSLNKGINPRNLNREEGLGYLLSLVSTAYR
jgi:hypothetical protein